MIMMLIVCMGDHNDGTNRTPRGEREKTCEKCDDSPPPRLPRRRIYWTHALISAPPTMQSSSIGTWWCATRSVLFKSDRRVYYTLYLPATCIVFHACCRWCSTRESIVSTTLGQNKYIAAFYIIWTMDLGAGEDWIGVLPTTRRIESRMHNF